MQKNQIDADRNKLLILKPSSKGINTLVEGVMRIAIQKKAKIDTIISTNHLASAAVFVIPLYPITKTITDNPTPSSFP